MPKYFSVPGFYIEVVRPANSIFNGVVYKNNAELSNITPTTLSIYLTDKSDYSFTFSDFSPTDPVGFVIRNYDTNQEIETIVFPLTTRLILSAGIDGETTGDVKVKYPLVDPFIIKNPG